MMAGFSNGAGPRRKPCARGLLILSLACCAVVLGCAGKVYPRRGLDAPPIVYCHDGVGHVSGAKPWILGGTCCCTPTPERFAGYQSEGAVAGDMKYDDFLKLFRDRNIITDLDVDYIGSNCRCDYGPHVVFGGRCMVTPTPGTKLYEEVAAGKRLPLLTGEK